MRFEQEENIRFKLSSGISWIDQSTEDMERFATLLEPIAGYELAALREVTVLSGSAVLALALVLGKGALGKGWLAPKSVWELCHIDEDFQAEQWGNDEEAQKTRNHRYREFQAVLGAFDPPVLTDANRP